MHKCIIVYKCLNGMAPQYLNDKITCNDDVHKYCTRSKDLHVISFEISGTLAYNNLPDHIKQQTSLNQFKISAKIHLLAQKQFQMITDFISLICI